MKASKKAGRKPGLQPRVAEVQTTCPLDQHALDAMEHGIFVFDKDLHCVTWNRSMERMTGVGIKAVLGQSASDVFLRPELAGFRDLILKALAGGKATSPDLCLEGTDGPLWISATFSPYRQDELGDMGVIGVMQDISVRKRTEHLLIEKLGRFYELSASLHEVCWMVSADLTEFYYLSPAYERVWGRKVQDLVENPSTWLDTIHSEDRERIVKTMEAGFTEKGAELEFRIVRPDGETRWIRARIFLVHDKPGNPQRIAGLCEDVTEKKQLEANALRSQRLENVGFLAGGIAHDLNNVLGPIMMGLQLLKKWVTSEHALKQIAVMQGATQRGAELVRQILSFARGGEGKRVETQIKHVVAEVEKIVKASFPKNIEVSRHLLNNLPPICADPTQIYQVLMNLCVNARDSMPEGGRLAFGSRNEVIVEDDGKDLVPWREPGPYVVITVSDTGTGISSEVQSKMFLPFFTTKDSDKGTGLGLSTVSAIVTAHNGFLKVSSEVGKGTLFEIWLPAVTSGKPDAPVPPDSESPRGNGELVLVVDDEQSFCEMARETLETHGYRVLLANDGAQAVSLVAHNRGTIRLLVTDLMMPHMDGLATIRTVRDIDQALKILVFSGFASEAMMSQRGWSELRGTCPFLRKPFTENQFLVAVRSALQLAA